MNDSDIMFGVLLTIQGASVLAAALSLVRSKINLRLFLFSLAVILFSGSVYQLSGEGAFLYPGLIIVFITTLFLMHYTWKRLYAVAAPEKASGGDLPLE